MKKKAAPKKKEVNLTQPGFSFILATSEVETDFKHYQEQISSYTKQPGQKVEFLFAAVGQPPSAEDEKIQVLSEKFNSKAAAVKALVENAQHEIIILLDEGLPVQLKEAEKLYREAKPDKHNRIAVANGRLDSTGKQSAKTPLSTKLGNFFIQILTSLETSDNFSGMQLYPAKIAKQVFTSKQFSVCPQISALNTCKQAGYRISEHQVSVNRKKASAGKTLSFIPMLLWFAFISRVNWFILQPIAELTKKQHLPAARNTDKGIFRLGFAAVFILLLSTMLFVSKDYGISGDEWLQHSYGNEIWDFFFHGDMSATKETGRIQSYDDVFYYSGGFELFYTFFTKAFPNKDPYVVRHFWNAFVGFLAIFFAALIGRSFGGWRMALIVLILMAVSPRFFGHAMNNSKDIPFAFAYIMGIYFILEFIKRLPKISSKYAFFLALSIGLAINARIGGLLVMVYLFFFVGLAYLDLLRQKKVNLNSIKAQFLPLTKVLVIVSVTGYAFGIIFWPYALLSPLVHPLESLSKMTDFHTVMGVLFEGERIMSNDLPWYYTFKWIYISIPEIVLIGVLLFALFSFSIIKVKGVLPVSLLLFSFLFPPLYAIYQESNVYDGWRHFIFIYPSLGAIGGIGIGFLLEKWRSNLVSYGVAGLVLVGAIFPLRFMLANHPHQVTYFNDLNGGIQAAYGNYETDYYMNSIRPAAMWLIDHRDLHNPADTIVVASNCSKELRHYLDFNETKTRTRFTHYNRRSELDWDYGVFYTRFTHRNILLNAFPPPGTIHVEEADGVPLAIVVERLSNEDYLGLEAMKRNDYQAALEHFRNYLEVDPNHDVVLENAALAALQTGDGATAMQFLERLLSFHPESFSGLFYAGSLQFQMDNLSDAMVYLQRALEVNPNVGQVYQLIGQIYERQGDSGRAQDYYRAAQSLQR